MKILFVASEGAPFSASGGLGDVIGALPGAIKKNDPSIDVEVVLPLYKSTKEKYMDELKGIERIIFANLYAGGFSKKLYRLYEYQKK